MKLVFTFQTKFVGFVQKVSFSNSQNVIQVKARSGSLIVITDEGNHELDELSEFVIHVRFLFVA